MVRLTFDIMSNYSRLADPFFVDFFCITDNVSHKESLKKNAALPPSFKQTLAGYGLPVTSQKVTYKFWVFCKGENSSFHLRRVLKNPHLEWMECNFTNTKFISSFLNVPDIPL